MTRLRSSGYGATSPAHVDAIVALGFTERQARFLTLVMRHSGVCVPRQYAQVAGIAQGAKCNAFFDRLVRRGHARAIECMHNRARLYLIHSKLLYHAIGEATSRYRRAVSPRLALERLMVLDAVLSTPVAEWLTTPAERAAALPVAASAKVSTDLPQIRGHFCRERRRSDWGLCGSEGARQGYPPFRRRCAALTRAMRSRWSGQLSERRRSPLSPLNQGWSGSPMRVRNSAT
jgi:hypothetical protein